LVQRLVEVHGALLALPGDAFAERYALLKQRDQLHAEIDELGLEVRDERSRVELERELAALQSQLLAIRTSKTDLSQGGGWGSPADAGGMVALNTEVERGRGGDMIKKRIGEILSLLNAMDTAGDKSTDESGSVDEGRGT
jgi:hypothetical protein